MRLLPGVIESLERIRLRLHFMWVRTALRRASTPSHLNENARARTLERLAEYERAGRFPRNTFQRGLAPVFVDGSGTRCAVAELLCAGGHWELVAALARRRNNAYVHELDEDRGLVAALADIGLEPGEAARIQPTYPGDIVARPHASLMLGEPWRAVVMWTVAGVIGWGVGIMLARSPRARRTLWGHLPWRLLVALGLFVGTFGTLVIVKWLYDWLTA
jgi:hypothetical protein